MNKARRAVASTLIAPFDTRILRTYHVCLCMVPYRSPEEARGAATRKRLRIYSYIFAVVVVSRAKKRVQSSWLRDRVRE